MNDKVPSPSSSPPEAGSPKMAPATRKRSHEEMNAKSKDAQASSNVAVEDDNTAKSQSKHTEDDASSSATMKPDNVSSSMPPPSLPASKVLSQKPPRSGQRSVLSTQALQQGEKVDAVPDDSNPGQDTHSNQHSSTDGEDEEDDELDAPTSSEPEHAIDDFDWSDLQERYHDRMKQLDDQESTIINEFNSLCDYFGVWAQAGSNHETDRSFKRMKTQMTLVQHHETQLEKKRQHYIKVVEAFQSALALLAN